MKKIIQNKVYDTDKAKLQASYSSDYPVSSFQYYEEALYLKKNGEYFLYGSGNAASPYAKKTAEVKVPGEKIVPFTYEEAKTWAEKKLDAEKYIELFEISKDSDASDIIIGIRRPTGLSKNAFAEKYGIPISTYEKWERGETCPPEYVINLLKFKVEFDLTAKEK